MDLCRPSLTLRVTMNGPPSVMRDQSTLTPLWDDALRLGTFAAPLDLPALCPLATCFQTYRQPPASGVPLVSRPSPLACFSPSAEFPKTAQGPIPTDGSSLINMRHSRSSLATNSPDPPDRPFRLPPGPPVREADPALALPALPPIRDRTPPPSRSLISARRSCLTARPLLA